MASEGQPDIISRRILSSAGEDFHSTANDLLVARKPRSSMTTDNDSDSSYVLFLHDLDWHDRD